MHLPVFVVLTFFTLALQTFSNADLSAEKKADVEFYVRTQGQAVHLDPESANFAVDEIIKTLEGSEDPPQRVRLLRTLMKLSTDGSISDGNNALIKSRMYAALAGPSDVERSYAISVVADLDGERSLSAIAPRLMDPHKLVRMDAERAFGNLGNAADLEVLSEVLKKRAIGLSPEIIEKDHSFEKGDAAIAKIKARLEGAVPEIREESRKQPVNVEPKILSAGVETKDERGSGIAPLPQGRGIGVKSAIWGVVLIAGAGFLLYVVSRRKT